MREVAHIFYKNRSFQIFLTWDRDNMKSSTLILVFKIKGLTYHIKMGISSLHSTAMVLSLRMATSAALSVTPLLRCASATLRKSHTGASTWCRTATQWRQDSLILINIRHILRATSKPKAYTHILNAIFNQTFYPFIFNKFILPLSFVPLTYSFSLFISMIKFLRLIYIFIYLLCATILILITIIFIDSIFNRYNSIMKNLTA